MKVDCRDGMEGRVIETVYSFDANSIDTNNTYADRYPPAELPQRGLVSKLRNYFSRKLLSLDNTK